MGKPDGRPWIEVGTSTRAAYVFSCPGHEEMMARRPAAGQTRDNLGKVVAYLHDWGLDWIPTPAAATITNAWTRVEHKRSGVRWQTGRTEGGKADVCQPVNLDRLARELRHITDWIICFGDCAAWAVGALKAQNRLPARMVSVQHLTHMSLIHVRTALGGTAIASLPEGEKRAAQLQVVAAQVAVQLGHQPPGLSLPGDAPVNPFVRPNVRRSVRTDLAWLERVATTVRASLGREPGFPRWYCHNASVALVMVLENLGNIAWTIRGFAQFDHPMPFYDDEPDTLDDRASHWWVESCGYWIDLTFDQFRQGLQQEPEPVSIWPAGESPHHIPGVDDPDESNHHEDELRADEEVLRVVRRAVRQLRIDL